MPWGDLAAILSAFGSMVTLLVIVVKFGKKQGADQVLQKNLLEGQIATHTKLDLLDQRMYEFALGATERQGKIETLQKDTKRLECKVDKEVIRLDTRIDKVEAKIK